MSDLFIAAHEISHRFIEIEGDHAWDMAIDQLGAYFSLIQKLHPEVSEMIGPFMDSCLVGARRATESEAVRRGLAVEIEADGFSARVLAKVIGANDQSKIDAGASVIGGVAFIQGCRDLGYSLTAANPAHDSFEVLGIALIRIVYGLARWESAVGVEGREVNGPLFECNMLMGIMGLWADIHRCLMTGVKGEFLLSLGPTLTRLCWREKMANGHSELLEPSIAGTMSGSDWASEGNRLLASIWNGYASYVTISPSSAEWLRQVNIDLTDNVRFATE